MNPQYVFRAKVAQLVAEGWSDARIINHFPDKRAPSVRITIHNVRTEADNAPPKKRGPWPVSYVRPDGQPVYRVAPGHDVPERSLEALGFQP